MASKYLEKINIHLNGERLDLLIAFMEERLSAYAGDADEALNEDIVWALNYELLQSLKAKRLRPQLSYTIVLDSVQAKAFYRYWKAEDVDNLYLNEIIRQTIAQIDKGLLNMTHSQIKKLPQWQTR